MEKSIIWGMLICIGMTMASCGNTNKTESSVDDMEIVEDQADKVLSQEVYKEQLEGVISYTAEEVDQVALFDASCLTASDAAQCSEEKLQSFVEQYLQLPGANEETEGKRMVTFIVNDIGDIEDVEFISTTETVCEECAELVNQAIATMPKWEPAVKDENPVPMQVEIVL